MKQIYKTLYYDEDTGRYIMLFDNCNRYVVNQESYLLAYILETLLSFKKQDEYELDGEENE